MGNLAGPGGKPQPSQMNRNVEPPKPLASPTTRVDSHGSDTGVQAMGVIGHSEPAVRSIGGHRTSVQPLPRHSRALGNPRPAPGQPSEPAPAPRDIRRPRPRPRRAGPAGRSPDPSSIPSVRQRRKECGKLPTRLKPASRPRPGCVRRSSPCWAALSASPASPSGAAAGGRPAPASPPHARIWSETRREPSFDSGRNTVTGAPVLRATRPS